MAVVLDVLPSVDRKISWNGNDVPGLRDEDDDFGDIRVAESDAMPLSKEALESRRIKSLLTETLIQIRTQGSIHSGTMSSVRDTSLVNVFLESEGVPFVLVGMAICREVRGHRLRMTSSAIELTLENFEDMLSSYAYAQHEVMLCLVCDFLVVTTPMWTSDAASESEMSERAISMVKLLVRRSVQLSWRVRLAVLLLIDEYLDYDPGMIVWHRHHETDMDVDGVSGGPTDVITLSSLDRDMRVRFRGATSTAGLLYLTSIPSGKHSNFYHETVNSLPREPSHWDSFLTDILWKLNCCIASAQLRAAAIYHLYEVPTSSGIFNDHLKVGLEHTADRLGLDGTSTLYLFHAPLIVSSQICAAQNPLQVPHSICGFDTQRSYARAILESATPVMASAMIAERSARRGDPSTGAHKVFGSICEAAGMIPADVVQRNLPSIVARILTEGQDMNRSMESLALLPGMDKSRNGKHLKAIAEDTAASILELLEPTLQNVVVTLLDQHTTLGGTNVFAAIVPEPAVVDVSTPGLPPQASLGQVLRALSYVKENSKLSDSKAVFASLVRLFDRVHGSFLVLEQTRRLAAVALIITLYVGEFQNPSILGLFLRECLPLLAMPDLCRMTFAMLQWGIAQLEKVVQPPQDLVLLLARLGTIGSDVAREETIPDELKDAIKSWLMDQAAIWDSSVNLRQAWRSAHSAWPADLRTGEAEESLSFSQIASQAHDIDLSRRTEICRPILSALKRDRLASTDALASFQHQHFWTLKEGLDASSEGFMDFLDLLYLARGEVHPPTLESYTEIFNEKTPSAKSSKEDATITLRATIVDKIAQITYRENHSERITAITALQALLSRVDDLRKSQHLSSGVKDLLSLLTVDQAVDNDTAATGLDGLSDAEKWIKLSGQPSIWIVDICKVVIGSIEHNADFYRALVPLLASMPQVAETLLPFLVHALLLGSIMLAGTASDDATALSSFFSAHLASLDTGEVVTQVIINVVLHLRRYRPPLSPGRAHELDYEEWLDLDYILLGEAAVRCGAYTTAIMFLEILRSGKNVTKPVDLYDPRTQSVSGLC